MFELTTRIMPTIMSAATTTSVIPMAASMCFLLRGQSAAPSRMMAMRSGADKTTGSPCGPRPVVRDERAERRRDVERPPAELVEVGADGAPVPRGTGPGR